ncbi:MAG: hypothetical protein ACOZE5_07375 [Verrucomicrobiota bacterium]
MSLNRCEQAVFDYWERAPDERRHWQGKVSELTFGGTDTGLARSLERDLWAYLVERSAHVPALRELRLDGGPRVSLLNLAEHMIRLWGPPPKPKKPAASR